MLELVSERSQDGQAVAKPTHLGIGSQNGHAGAKNTRNAQARTVVVDHSRLWVIQRALVLFADGQLLNQVFVVRNSKQILNGYFHHGEVLLRNVQVDSAGGFGKAALGHVVQAHRYGDAISEKVVRSSQ